MTNAAAGLLTRGGDTDNQGTLGPGHCVIITSPVTTTTLIAVTPPVTHGHMSQVPAPYFWVMRASFDNSFSGRSSNIFIFLNTAAAGDNVSW